MKIRQVFTAADSGEGTVSGGCRYCERCGTALALTEAEGRTRDVCPACGRVIYRNPVPAVSVLIVREGRVLLGKRRTKSVYPGLWCLPCGFIEHDEDFLTAAIREAKEETGLTISLRAIINVAHNHLRGGLHTLVPVLLADAGEGTAQAGDDLVDLRWVGPADALPQLAFEADEYIITRYFEGAIAGLPIDARYSSG